MISAEFVLSWYLTTDYSQLSLAISQWVGVVAVSDAYVGNSDNENRWFLLTKLRLKLLK